MLTGFTSKDKLTRDSMKVEPTTVQPLTSLYHGPNGFPFVTIVPLNTATTKLSATTTDGKTLSFSPALAFACDRGDFIQPATGLYKNYLFPILTGGTSSCVLAVNLPASLSSGLTINIVRPMALPLSSTGNLNININQITAALGVNCSDGSGNKLVTSTSAPVGNETGLIVRNIPPNYQNILIDGQSTVNQDLLTSFATGVITLGYDVGIGNFGAIPLSNGGLTVPVELLGGAVTYLYGFRDDTAPATTPENSNGPIRITEYRAAHANLRDTNGNEIASATASAGSAVRGIVARSIESGPATSSVGSASVTTSATTVMSSNGERRGFTLLLDPAATDSVYVKFGSSASSTDYNIYLPKGSVTPFVAGPGCYTGTITAASASGTQTVRYWEGTP